MLISSVTPINHILRNEQWASKRLQSFSGMTIGIRIFPLPIHHMRIDESGTMQPMQDDPDPDVTLTLSPTILPRLLTKEVSAFEQISIAGNRSLGDTLISIAKSLDLGILLESDLSKILGDIPAHRLAQSGMRLLHWHTESMALLCQSWTEYCTEEQPILAKATALTHFAAEIEVLQLQADQLEQRLDQLSLR